jgi:hypothetical protein
MKYADAYRAQSLKRISFYKVLVWNAMLARSRSQGVFHKDSKETLLLMLAVVQNVPHNLLTACMNQNHNRITL